MKKIIKLLMFIFFIAIIVVLTINLYVVCITKSKIKQIEDLTKEELEEIVLVLC